VVSGNTTVQQYIENAMKSNGTGTVTFTLGHANAVRNQARPGYASYYFNLTGDGQTGYPLGTPAQKLPSGETCYQLEYAYAYAGWSMIIFYRTPALVQRQLYLYDLCPEHNSNGISYFTQVSSYGNPQTVNITVSGFLAPPSISEIDKSHVTYFVGEGDAYYTGDSIKVNNSTLCYPPDAPNGPCSSYNPSDNVFNSYSNALTPQTTGGVDVDTFILPSNCILPYATSAKVQLITTTDPTYHLAEMYTLVYLVLSFRSDLTTGGIITNYSVRIS
jgi:hypothetical protein